MYRIWCLSLERKTCTALNSSNPTPHPCTHAFGHFLATGSLTVHGELLGIHRPSLCSGGCVGGELHPNVHLSAGVHGRMCTSGRKVLSVM